MRGRGETWIVGEMSREGCGENAYNFGYIVGVLGGDRGRWRREMGRRREGSEGERERRREKGR